MGQAFHIKQKPSTEAGIRLAGCREAEAARKYSDRVEHTGAEGGPISMAGTVQHVYLPDNGRKV
jgi:hypothetical protein